MHTVTQEMPTMLAFSEDGNRAAAEGTVNQRFDIEPAQGSGQLNPAYLALSKQRTQAGSVKMRKVQVMTEHQITNIRHPVGLMELGAGKRKEPLEKRIAKPAEELQADLFRLFERQGHWAFVQLQRQTQQPTQHLKTVLSEIAVQNRRGPYKDLWELKREFKTSL